MNTTTKNYANSLFLDTRRKKKNGKYPVKLRVWNPQTKKQKLYPTVFELTQNEFDSIWLTSKTRNEHKATKNKMAALLKMADDIAEKLKIFNFNDFEAKMMVKPNEGTYVKSRYDIFIRRLIQKQSFGTASNYQLAAKSIENFCADVKHQNFDDLQFFQINKDWLEDYEFYMITTKGRSSTTVSMYARTLRTLFNDAIDNEIVPAENYPFKGKNGYKVPSGTAVKKALNDNQIKLLFNCKPENEFQQRAKDFFFFIFFCGGINIADIARLKNRNLRNSELVFFREKTKNTSKSNSKPISISLNDYGIDFIEKYRSQNTSPDDYLFSILSSDMTPEEQFRSAKNFNRLINQHLKKLVLNIEGLPNDISVYFARHSFATTAVNNGFSKELVQAALGHANIRTTENYFAGFTSEVQKRLADNLLCLVQ
jgi:integrase/recombinase XerD